MSKLDIILHTYKSKFVLPHFVVPIVKTCVFKKKKNKIKEHFVNKKVSVGRGKFLKKIKDDIYAQCW